MGFVWDAVAGRYRDSASGRFLREEPIRGALDAVIDYQATQMRTLTQALLDGQIPLSAWQAQMMQSIKSVQLVGLSLGAGGWSQLDQTDYGWVGQRIRTQYAFLRGFAADLAAGWLSLRQALVRAELYAGAGRATHRAAQEREAKQRGLEMERNQLGSADHCAGCLSATAQGWVPIGTLVPCGSRDCLSRCRCSLIYRMGQAA